MERTLSLVELDPVVPGPVPGPAALPDRIYATLKYRILTCTMRPGERIVEKDLCAEMQLSRTPLREAVNRLALEGLIIVSPYRGYSVAPLSVAAYRELCGLRRIVEGGVAALAAGIATRADVERLIETADTSYTRGNRESYLGYLRKNSSFHLSLVRITGNRQLEGILMSALDRHQRPLYLGLDVGIDGNACTEEHLGITRAIADHHPARARKLMVKHISGVEDRIVAALRRAGY